MKKGRRYIEPMTGSGDETVKKRDVKKIKREAGKTFDGVSRPSNDQYREEWTEYLVRMKKKTKNLIKEILYYYPITIIIPIMLIIVLLGAFRII